jgi:hypothetical protein
MNFIIKLSVNWFNPLRGCCHRTFIIPPLHRIAVKLSGGGFRDFQIAVKL